MLSAMLFLWGPWVGFRVIELAFLSLDVPGNAEPVRLTISSPLWALFSCLAWVWGLDLLQTFPSYELKFPTLLPRRGSGMGYL